VRKESRVRRRGSLFCDRGGRGDFGMVGFIRGVVSGCVRGGGGESGVGLVGEGGAAASSCSWIHSSSSMEAVFWREEVQGVTRWSFFSVCDSPTSSSRRRDSCRSCIFCIGVVKLDQVELEGEVTDVTEEAVVLVVAIVVEEVMRTRGMEEGR